MIPPIRDRPPKPALERPIQPLPQPLVIPKMLRCHLPRPSRQLLPKRRIKRKIRRRAPMNIHELSPPRLRQRLRLRQDLRKQPGQFHIIRPPGQGRRSTKNSGSANARLSRQRVQTRCSSVSILVRNSLIAS